MTAATLTECLGVVLSMVITSRVPYTQIHVCTSADTHARELRSCGLSTDAVLTDTIDPSADRAVYKQIADHLRAIRQAFNRARVTAGMPGFRFHDLRHTGQTLAAATGATVKDLMRRLGHASPVASYRYLHAVDGRDAEIAAALSDLAAHGDAARLPKSIVIKH
jgi:integrase